MLYRGEERYRRFSDLIDVLLRKLREIKAQLGTDLGDPLGAVTGGHVAREILVGPDVEGSDRGHFVSRLLRK